MQSSGSCQSNFSCDSSSSKQALHPFKCTHSSAPKSPLTRRMINCEKLLNKPRILKAVTARPMKTGLWLNSPWQYSSTINDSLASQALRCGQSRGQGFHDPEDFPRTQPRRVRISRAQGNFTTVYEQIIITWPRSMNGLGPTLVSGTTVKKTQMNG